MDEQKKALLKEKFSEAEKAENKKAFDKYFAKLVGDMIDRAAKRRDMKVLN
jgi:hypothetical protein